MSSNVLQTSFEAPPAAVDSTDSLLERYERAARCGGEGLWDWDLVSGTVWYSPALKALLGWSENDRFPNTFAGFQEHIPAEHRSQVLRGVRQHLEQRHPLNLDFPMQTRGGVLRWFNMRGAAERDPAGHPQRLSGSLHDITDQRRAMDISGTLEALEFSHDFYKRILDAIPIQISYIDKEQRILYMNSAYERWFQLPLAAMRGRQVAEVISPERHREVTPRIEAALAGRSVEFEEHATRADGVERELVVNYVAHRDANEEVVGFLSIVRDVTEQKRLEASLRQSQKMEAVGQLTGGIAHDFNNMLSVVIGNLQLLERPLRGHERLLKHVRTALRASLGGADLTRRLLTFARQTALEPRVINPNTLIEGMHELLRRSLGCEIEIVSGLTAEPWPIRADASQLENCLLNLAINARDAMPRGGRLTIETRNITVDEPLARRHPQLRERQYLSVSVTDTGAGMARDVLKRAFEPFFTTKEVGKGTGLGLSMVYSFLEQSGGIAALYSEPNIGTTVRLYFPRVDAAVAPPHPAKPGQGESHPAPRGSEIVMVVEDDADVRATAVGALRSFGYRVLEAGTAAQALGFFESGSEVDLLFTDITLPGGFHGPALAGHAQTIKPGLKVLYTSGFSESVVIRRGILDGSLPMIPKPYAIADLATRVRAALDQGPALVKGRPLVKD